MAARRAGHTPKIIPTPAANANAMTSGADIDRRRATRTTATARSMRQRRARCRAAPPGDTQRDGLDEELEEDVPSRGAERFANADLARAFGDRDEHDVHDADAADEQTTQRRCRRAASVKVGSGLAERAEQVRLIPNAEVVRAARRQGGASGAAPAGFHPSRRSTRIRRRDARPDVVDAIRAEDPEPARAERDENLLVVVAEAGRALARPARRSP